MWDQSVHACHKAQKPVWITQIHQVSTAGASLGLPLETCSRCHLHSLSLSLSLSISCASEVPPPPLLMVRHKQMCRHREGKKSAFLFLCSLIYRVVSAQMSLRWGLVIRSNQASSRGICPLDSAPPLLVLEVVDERQPVGPLLMCLSDGVHESLIWHMIIYENVNQ